MPQNRNKPSFPIQRPPACLTFHCRLRQAPLTWLNHIFPQRKVERTAQVPPGIVLNPKAELRCPLTAGSFNPCQGFSVKLLWAVCSQSPGQGDFFRVVLMCLPHQIQLCSPAQNSWGQLSHCSPSTCPKCVCTPGRQDAEGTLYCLHLQSFIQKWHKNQNLALSTHFRSVLLPNTLDWEPRHPKVKLGAHKLPEIKLHQLCDKWLLNLPQTQTILLRPQMTQIWSTVSSLKT